MSIIRSLAKQRQLIETDENTEDISQFKPTESGNNSIKRIFFVFSLQTFPTVLGDPFFPVIVQTNAELQWFYP